MLVSSLSNPDGERWRGETDHSRAVAAVLRDCYAHLARATTHADSYLRAYENARACLNKPMSMRQRMRLFFVLGMAYIGGGEYIAGAKCLLETLQIANQLHDLAACAESTYLLGSAHAANFQYAVAAEYFRAALELLDLLGSGDAPADPTLTSGVFLSLAIAEFTLEEWESAQQHLRRARLLLGSSANTALQRANIDWAEAVLLRWRGQPDQALPYAIRAADAYAQALSSVTQLASARLQSIVADIALDLAETCSPDAPHHGFEGFVQLARPYVARAVQLSEVTLDPAGEVLVLLSRQRFDRITRRTTDRRASLEVALQRAQALDDILLQAQAYTALGQEFATRDERESSLTAYRNALAVIGGSDAPAMGAWARRALVAASTSS